MPRKRISKRKLTGINVRGSDPKRTKYHRLYYRLRRAKTDKRRK